MMRLLLVYILIALPLHLSAQSTEVELDLFESMRGADKAAVVAVHQGCADEADRKACIEPFNRQLQAAYPQCAFREAWTNIPAIQAAGERGLVKRTLTAVLNELLQDGYTHLLLQPSCVTEGTDMEYLRYELSLYANRFKQIRMGRPLLSTSADYERVILVTAANYGRAKVANVLVTDDAGDNPASLAMLDYMLRDLGYADWFVVSSEGFPTPEQLQRQLKQRKQKKLHLIPFSFTRGSSGSLETIGQTLHKAGYKLTQADPPLGEQAEIVQLYIAHARHAQQYRTYTPLELKMQGALAPRR